VVKDHALLAGLDALPVGARMWSFGLDTITRRQSDERSLYAHTSLNITRPVVKAWLRMKLYISAPLIWNIEKMSGLQSALPLCAEHGCAPFTVHHNIAVFGMIMYNATGLDIRMGLRVLTPAMSSGFCGEHKLRKSF
jgi:hypothetical protein